jgi:hypothetical protein
MGIPQGEPKADEFCIRDGEVQKRSHEPQRLLFDSVDTLLHLQLQMYQVFPYRRPGNESRATSVSGVFRVAASTSCWRGSKTIGCRSGGFHRTGRCAWNKLLTVRRPMRTSKKSGCLQIEMLSPKMMHSASWFCGAVLESFVSFGWTRGRVTSAGPRLRHAIRICR